MKPNRTPQMTQTQKHLLDKTKYQRAKGFVSLAEAGFKSGSDPINKSSVDFDSMLECRPIRDASIDHVPDVIGRILG